MGEKINIGVVGCANIAQRSVIPAMMDLSGKFNLVAIASRTLDKAEALAARFNCEAIEGYENIINADRIDALYIPLPTGLHKEWINKALSSGKHVYAEKAIARNLEDAKEMVEKAGQKDLALMEGYMFQYHSQHEIVQDLIRDGEIGGLRYFSSSFGFPPLDKNNFRYDKVLGGGALMDAAGYPVRATHFLLGKDFEVKGASLYHDPNLESSIYGSAYLSNSKGMGASVSFGFDNFYQCRYEIWGEKGKIIAEKAFTPRFDERPNIVIEKPEGAKTIKAEPDNHFSKAFEEFHKAVIDPATREKHYGDILLQSKTLEQIETLNH